MKKREKKLVLSRETVYDQETKSPAFLRQVVGGAEEEPCANPPSSHPPHYCP